MNTPLLVFAFALFFVLLPTGCAPSRNTAKSPATSVQVGSINLNQGGDAKAPASATSKTKTSTLTLPSGSSLVFNDKLGTVEVKFGGAASLQVETRDDTATAAAAFTPPAPPTPSEEMDGEIKKYLWIGLVFGVALTALGIWWRGKFVIIGGVIAACACAFGLFIQSNPWVLTVAGVGALTAGGGWLAWHLWVKPKPISAY